MTAELLILLMALCFCPMPEADFVRYAAEVCATYYGVDPTQVNCMVQAESEWNPNARRHDDGGPGIDAVGLAQFHLESWRHLRRAIGAPETDRRLDPVESLATMCWALAQGDTYSKWWTSYDGCLKEAR